MNPGDLGEVRENVFSEEFGGEVPAASVDLIPDSRYAGLEVHKLPLEARKVEFLRVDGFWYAKVSEGAQEAMEETWRQALENSLNREDLFENHPLIRKALDQFRDEIKRCTHLECTHRRVIVSEGGWPKGRCEDCRAEMDYDQDSRNWIPVKVGVA